MVHASFRSVITAGADPPVVMVVVALGAPASAAGGVYTPASEGVVVVASPGASAQQPGLVPPLADSGLPSGMETVALSQTLSPAWPMLTHGGGCMEQVQGVRAPVSTGNELLCVLPLADHVLFMR